MQQQTKPHMTTLSNQIHSTSFVLDGKYHFVQQ